MAEIRTSYRWLPQTLEPEAAARALESLAESGLEARDALERAEPKFLRGLADLLVVSPVMLDSLRRHPAWIGWLAARLASRGAPRDVPEAEDRTTLDALRAWKRRQYLDIAYRDLTGLASFEETVTRLSRLADTIASQALAHCRRELAGAAPASPSPEGSGGAGWPEPQGFALFALGKLGGAELNYSSDIDLVFVRRPAVDDAVELHFFTHLGERLVQALSQGGPDGFLYRVDMRLRPYGETGPLVPTIASLENYYESWSEAWERQALVKLRFVCGDAAIGRRFTDFARRFVWARQMDDAALEEIKRVKHRAEREYALPAGRFHLKQGPGGIRDIEFYVQYLQLIAGSTREDVRTGSTLEAIARLAAARLLLEGEEAELSVGYRFFRIVEHHLQLRALTPAAALPEKPAELQLLARGLGFEGTAAGERLQAAIEGRRGRMRAILERIYLAPGQIHLHGQEEELAQLLTERTPRARVREILSRYGFEEVDRAWENLRLLALGPSGRLLPPAERRAFFGFAFTLLEVARDSIDPDRALDALESLASASGNRVSFLRAVASRPRQLVRLVNLLSLSRSAHDVLVRHPEYFDTLARGERVAAHPTASELRVELDARAAAGAPDARNYALRRFRQREMLRIAYRDIAELADSLQVSAELSALAEACVTAAFDWSRSSAPEDDFDAGPAGEPLAVVALGKLGSRQMHFASDLDLIFLYDDPAGEVASDARARFARAQERRVERILDILAGVTSEGIAYRVDLRLRPDGASALLVRSCASFLDHAGGFMQPWERLALVRSRMLVGDAPRWAEILDQIVYRFDWNETALGEIRHLKRRIEGEKSRESRNHLDFKYGAGGIADLEFLVQTLQALHGAEHPGVRTPEVARAIPALVEAGALGRDDGAALEAAHRFQRKVENHFQLIEEWMSRELTHDSPHLTRLARSLGLAGRTRHDLRDAFLAAWRAHAAAVRRLVEKHFYRNANEDDV